MRTAREMEAGLQWEVENEHADKAVRKSKRRRKLKREKKVYASSQLSCPRLFIFQAELNMSLL